MRKYVAVMFALIALVLSACPAEEKNSADVFALDTYISMTAYGENSQKALEKAEALLTEREGLWSVTLADSEIGRINQAGGEAVSVSSVTADLLKRALSMAEETDGAFDPTIYPLVSAWGFTTDTYRIPGQTEIGEKLSLVDYKAVSVKEDSVKIGIGMQLDLGGIAKGYIGDEIAALMRKCGVDSAMISLGGNIHVVGSKPDGSAWQIGIKSPEDDGLLGVLAVRDQCVITSGAYERYFVGEDSRKYGHIIDPSTGYPADNGILSVTVTGGEGAVCDELSTAVFVMGLDKGCEYWRSSGEFEMIILTDDHVLYITEGIRESFRAVESDLIREVCIIER